MVELSRCRFFVTPNFGLEKHLETINSSINGPGSFQTMTSFGALRAIWVGASPQEQQNVSKCPNKSTWVFFETKFYQIICSLLTCLISLSRKNFVVAKGAARRFSIGEDQTNNTLHWTVVFFSLIPKGDTIYLTSNFAGRSSYVDFWETRTLLSSGWFFPR